MVRRTGLFTRVAALTVVLVTALFAAACGSSDDDASTASSSTPASGSTAPAKPAPKGAVFKVGLIEDLSGPVGSFPEQKAASEAAIKYVNEKLGGAGGRPLELVNCAANGTPEAALRCANELVAKKIDVSMGGSTQGGSAPDELFFRNNIPIIGGQPLTEPASNSKLGFFFGPVGAASFGALTAFMQAKGFTTVGTIGPDVPIVTFVGGLVKAQGAKLGQTVTNATYPAGSPSIAPAVTKAVTGNAKGLIAMDVAPGCVGTMKAVQSLGLNDLTIGLPHSCAGPSVFAAAPPAVLARAVYQYPVLPVTADDADVKTYVQAMHDFGAPDKYTNAEYAQLHFQAVMNIKELADEIVTTGGKFTTDSLVAALRKTHDHHNFMGHPYTCDRKQVPFVPSLCSPFGRIVQYKDGKIVDTGGKWYDVTAGG